MRKVMRFILTIILLTSTPSLSFADISKVLFLDQALSSAILNNPELQTEISRLGLSKADVFSASSLVNPFFTFEYNSLAKTYKYGAQQAMELGFLRSKRMKLANLRNELDTILLKKKVIDLRYKVRTAYIRHYINREKLDNMERIRDQILGLLKNSNLSDSEKIQLQLVSIRLYQSTEDAHYELIKSSAILEDALARPIDENTKLDMPKEPPACIAEVLGKSDKLTEQEFIQQLYNVAMARRPEIQENQKLMEITKQQKRLSQAQRWPLMVNEVAYRRSFFTDVNGMSVASNVEIPVRDFETQNIKAAETRMKYYEDKDKNDKKDILLDIKTRYRIYTHAKERFYLFENDFLPRAKAVSDNATAKLKSKSITYINYANEEKAYIDIQNAYYDAYWEYQNAISELARVAGECG